MEERGNMFNKKDATVKFDGEKIDSIVSSDVCIDGKFSSKGYIRLDCTIDGDVDSESLYIGEVGKIHGNIKCENIIIAGTVIGNIDCSNKIHIKDKGSVNGDLNVNIISMDEGAVFTGNCSSKIVVLSQAEQD